GRDRRVAVTGEDPHQAEPLGHGIDPHGDLAGDRRARAVGDRGAHHAGVQPVGPSVVGAGDGAGEVRLAEAERHPRVGTAVGERVHPVPVPAEDDALAEELDGDWPVADRGRPGDRVPEVPEPERAGLVDRPRAPVAAIRRAVEADDVERVGGTIGHVMAIPFETPWSPPYYM